MQNKKSQKKLKIFCGETFDEQRDIDLLDRIEREETMQKEQDLNKNTQDAK